MHWPRESACGHIVLAYGWCSSFQNKRGIDCCLSFGTSELSSNIESYDFKRLVIEKQDCVLSVTYFTLFEDNRTLKAILMELLFKLSHLLLLIL